MLWVIGITVPATSLVLILLQNFKTPEKVLERKIAHRYVVSDPQFRREMSVARKIFRKDFATDQITTLIKN